METVTNLGKRGPKRPRMSKVVLSRMGIPETLHTFDLEELNDQGIEERKKVIDYVKKYINNLDFAFDNNVGLFFFGANGVGKSTLASLIIREAYRWRYRCKRCTFTDYVNELSKTWEAPKIGHWGEDDAESLFYHNYKAVDFLVIEELGKENLNDMMIRSLEDLLRYREERGLPTIICSNLDTKLLEDRYGASVFSLLVGNFQPIKVVGEDLRQQINKNLLEF